MMSMEERIRAGSAEQVGNMETATDDTSIQPRRPVRSPRGERTRASLVRSARVVFEQHGFLNAKITDIAETAQVAIGSFYTYFTSKEEIFTAVMDEVQDEMLHPQRVVARHAGDTIHDSVESSTRDYLAAYQRNAKLMAVLEEVAAINPEFRSIRIRRADAFTERNAKTIERLQAKGFADRELDAYLSAHALSSMVSRVAYNAFVLNTGHELEKLVSTLTRLWLNALGVDKTLWATPL